MKQSSKFLLIEPRCIKVSGYLIYGFIGEGQYIIPPHCQPRKFNGDTLLWILPVEGNEKSLMIQCEKYLVKTDRKGVSFISFTNEYKEVGSVVQLPCIHL